MRTICVSVGISFVLATGACQDPERIDHTPHLVPGGGIGAGAIDGLMNIYVTDDETDAPLSGATVRVGTSSAPAPCLGTTDSTGLAVLDGASCPGLKGPQTVTASAGGHAPATWIGADGTNLTMSLKASGAPAIPTASVSGTIEGWGALPAPATGHTTLGIVGYTQTRQLGDRANDLVQGKRTVTVGAWTGEIAANACVLTAQVSDCQWQMTTRTGPQAHFAVLLDQDTKGTAAEADDTFTVLGWAVKTGLSFNAGDIAAGETLPMIKAADMATLSIAFGAAPAGLDDVMALPLIDLGAEGRLFISAPRLDASNGSAPIPKLTGVLAAGRYEVIGRVQDAKDKDQPATLEWLRAVNVGATVTVGGWLSPPSALTASAGQYSFSAVAGASIHGADFKTVTGDQTLWSVTIFDGSTSFTLPGLTPDPLPAGMVRLVVNAIEIPGVDLRNVSFDAAIEQLTRLASDAITFTH